MLAEAIHSVADTSNQVLLLLGGKRAKKKATPLHQFGYGRERYFWSFVVSIILFTAGALFAIYEGVHKVQHPEPISSAGWAIGVLSVAIILETISFRTAIVEASPLRRGASWPEYIRRSKVPELPVVLLEDLGALVGLILALGAVIMAIVTGNGVWDGVGSLTIGALLFVIAVVLAVEMKSLLIGEAAAPEVEEQIVVAIIETDSVVHLINIRTEHIGPEEILVVAKVEFREDLRMRDLAAEVDRVEARVRASVPEATLLFIEPDIRREPVTSGAADTQ
jgi:cation diffusion facilitator family transporter